MAERNDGRARLPEEPGRDEAEAQTNQEPELVVEGEIVEEGPDETTNERATLDWEQVAQERQDALLRLQADFDNFRKRMMRDQAEVIQRAAERLVERLLPVLDNFDRAVAHGEASPGLSLVHRELLEVLAAEGLERIDPGGVSFDPRLHEAVESHEDPRLSEPVVSEVHRAGYLFKSKVLRPALVAVARPVEASPADAPEPDEG